MRRAALLLILMIPVALPQIRGGGGGGGNRGGFDGGGGRMGPGPGGGGIGSRPVAPVQNPYNMGPTPFSAGGVGGINSGFGSVVFPSGVTSFGSYINPIYSSPVYTNNNTFASRLGGVVSGVPPVYGAERPNFIEGNYSTTYGTWNNRGRTTVYPVPVFVGGG